MNCKDCGRPMRTTGKTRADYPGTIRHAGRGLCGRCHKHRAKAGTLHEVPTTVGSAPTQCKECHVTLRSKLHTQEDRPETRARAGRGFCSTCYARHHRAGTLDNVRTYTKPGAESAEPNEPLAAYLRSRRERLARQKRMQRGRVAA